MKDNKIVRLLFVGLIYLAIFLAVGGSFLQLFNTVNETRPEYIRSDYLNYIQLLINYFTQDFSTLYDPSLPSFLPNVIFSISFNIYVAMLIVGSYIVTVVGLIGTIVQNVKFIKGEGKYNPAWGIRIAACYLATVAILNFVFYRGRYDFDIGSILIYAGMGVALSSRLLGEFLFEENNAGMLSYVGPSVRFVISLLFVVASLAAFHNTYNISDTFGYDALEGQFYLSRAIAVQYMNDDNGVMMAAPLICWIFMGSLCVSLPSSSVNCINYRKKAKYEEEGKYFNLNVGFIRTSIASLVLVLLSYVLSTLLKGPSYTYNIGFGIGLYLLVSFLGVSIVLSIGAYFVDKKIHQ